MTGRKKLIEVALPLDAINVALRGKSRSVTGTLLPSTSGGHVALSRRRGLLSSASL